MRRSTRTALLVAIVLLLAGGVATAAVRGSRDESPTAAAPVTTVPDAPKLPSQPAPPPVPTSVAAAASTTIVPAPTTVAPPAVEQPSGPAAGPGPTTTTGPPPISAMPNTGGDRLPAAGVLLVAVGLLGWRLSAGKRWAP